MNLHPVFIAQIPIEPQDALAPWSSMSPAMRETLILVGAMAFIALLIALWAVFLRKRGRRRHHHPHRHHHSQTERGPAPEAVPENRRRKWRRKRRRDHRPRNPTLAETGGLPPVRAQEPIDPHV